MALGKIIAKRTYLHVSAIDEASEDYQQALDQAETLCNISREYDFNVIRFELALNRIALLNYPTFFDEAFPALQESWNIDLSASEYSRRTYTPLCQHSCPSVRINFNNHRAWAKRGINELSKRTKRDRTEENATAAQ